jgi:hypothetical protein
MRMLLIPSLALLLAAPLLAQEDEARAILQKAVHAHGGEKILGKFTASHSRTKGRFHVLGGVDVATEEDMQFPAKYKSVGEIDANGKKVSLSQVFNGTKGWLKIMGKTMDLTNKEVEEIKEILHQHRLENPLIPLKEKGFKLNLIGGVKVKNRDAIGVRVSCEGRRDINLYFDKTSGLLVKTEARGIDPITTKEGNHEKFFSDYRKIEGRKCAHKIELHSDGKFLLELEILELRLLEKHDDSTFNRP